MQFVDVGSRAFIFGGAYGNIQATKAVFETAEQMGYSTQEMIFTGDMVAYCANPQETTDLIRQSGCHIIAGNCEESLATGASDCGCGFEEDTECNVLSDQWFRFCQANLSNEAKTWMGTLPEHLHLKIGDFYLLCCHGTPELINQFTFSSDLEHGNYAPPNDRQFDGFVVGHSGIPFLSRTQHHIWMNSGASGMPANDGTSNVWACALEAKNGTLETQLIAIDYDFEAAASAMRTAKLPVGYMECLSTGLWPSLDVLPEFEKKQTGIPIQPIKKAFEKTPF